jgi:iron-sulfur cluster repair protein YtfE (RIC family)
VAGTLDRLREEHRDLAIELEELKTTGDLAVSEDLDQLSQRLQTNLGYLSDHLLPHARAEEQVVYRAYDQLANSPWATDTLRRDHAEVVRLTGELAELSRHAASGPLTPALRREIQRLLYGLHALLRLHFDHEEALILPRLEAGLSEDAARQLLDSLEELMGDHQAA